MGKKDGLCHPNSNTLYKLIRLLELVPDGGEIVWERDICQ